MCPSQRKIRQTCFLLSLPEGGKIAKERKKKHGQTQGHTFKPRDF